MSPSRSAGLGALLMVLLGAASLALDGCAVDAQGDPGAGLKTRSDYDEVAQALGSMIGLEAGGEAASLADAVAIARGMVPTGFGIAADGAVVGDRGALHYGYATGCGPTGPAGCARRADGVALEVTWSGDYDTPRFSGAVTRCGDWTLGGLETAAARLDGDSDFIFHSTVRAVGHADRVYHLQATAAYRDLAIDVATGMVIGGTIAYGLDAAPLIGDRRDRTFTLDAALVFETSGRAELTLDGEHRYGVDTLTGVINPR
jgi:hypothetical protein